MNTSHYRQLRSATWRHLFLFATFITVAIGFSICLTAPPAYSAPRSTCWENRLYLGFEYTFDGPITTAGNRVFVAGAGPFTGSPSSHAAVRVRAYSLTAGQLLWENVWQPVYKDNSPTGIVHVRGVIVTTAETGLNVISTDVQDSSLALSAYSASNGRLLWNDRCLGGLPVRAQPKGPNDALLALMGRVVVAGNCDANETGVTSGLLRAYDPRTGKVAWQVVDPSAIQLRIASDFTRVFDLVLNASNTLTLRAYEGSFGTLLWETEVPNRQVTHIAAGDGRVFVAGAQIIAFDESSGALEWAITPANYVQGLAERRGRVFVAENGDNVLAAAYSAHTGALLWQDGPDSEAGPFTAQAVTTGRHVLLVAGTRKDTAAESASHLAVRTYSLSGKFLSESGEPTTAVLDATASDVAWTHGFSIESGMAGHEVAPYGVQEGVLRICRSSHH